MNVPFSVGSYGDHGDIDARGPRAVEPGSYQVQVGSLSADFTVH